MDSARAAETVEPFGQAAAPDAQARAIEVADGHVQQELEPRGSPLPRYDSRPFAPARAHKIATVAPSARGADATLDERSKAP